MRKIISRPNPNELPALPLPFHVRSVGYNEAPGGWFERVDGALKNLVQLFWTVDGAGEVVLPDRTFRVSRGEVFYHLPLEEHYHKSVDRVHQWRYYWFTFDGPGAAAFMNTYGYPGDGFYAGECPTQHFLEIESLLKQRTPYAQRHAIAAAAEILALAGGTLGHSQEHDLVKDFIQLAHEEYGNAGTTVQSLAEKLGVHRTTLNRVFLRAMAIAPGDYLAQIRIQHALSLLRETNLPVKEVAYECGMVYESYFCRLIRRKTGMSPIQYRQHSPMD